mgnify:CR=1 FL=1
MFKNSMSHHRNRDEPCVDTELLLANRAQADAMAAYDNLIVALKLKRDQDEEPQFLPTEPLD